MLQCPACYLMKCELKNKCILNLPYFLFWLDMCMLYVAIICAGVNCVTCVWHCVCAFNKVWWNSMALDAASATPNEVQWKFSGVIALSSLSLRIKNLLRKYASYYANQEFPFEFLSMRIKINFMFWKKCLEMKPEYSILGNGTTYLFVWCYFSSK